MPGYSSNRKEGLRVGIRFDVPKRKGLAPDPRPVGRRAAESGWVETAWAEAELTGELAGWTLRAEFELRSGRVVFRSVSYTPPDGTVGLGSLSDSALKRLSLKGLTASIEDELRFIEAAHPGIATGWIDALTAGRRPGVRGADPMTYLEWAKRRVEAERQAPDRPIKWLVDQYGGPPYCYSEAAINKYVFKAREKGFLPPRGEPVELTEQAKRLMAPGQESD
jgi:hypothetical protein